MKNTIRAILLIAFLSSGASSDQVTDMDKVTTTRESVTFGFDLSEENLLMIGDSSLEKDEFDNAVAAYRKALSNEKCVNRSKFYFRLAYVAAIQGKPEAKSLLQKALAAEKDELSQASE